jgi:hypothetical protein
MHGYGHYHETYRRVEGKWRTVRSALCWRPPSIRS